MRGNDALFGGIGHDTLSGGAGNDTLTGGEGLDNFLFDRTLGTATNVDVITDFSHLDDTIWLDASIFTSLSALVGTSLVSTMFYIGSEAADGDDYIVYDLDTGALFYDADGSGADFASILFATFAAGSIPLDLSFDDFTIVTLVPGAIEAAVDRPDGFNPVEVSSGSTDGVRGLTDAEIIGSNEDDVIHAKSANDRIFGKGGDDLLSGGAGNDSIDGGTGSDTINGDDGNDILIGGGSNVNQTGGPLLNVAGEKIYGGNGNDFIQGSDQLNDWTLFNAGDYYDDYIFGDLGDDIIYGLGGDDSLFGDNYDFSNAGGAMIGGNDTIYGGDGSDFIWGGFGDDRIYAGTGYRNIVHGGAVSGTYQEGPGGLGGVDTLVFESSFDAYRITGLNSELLVVERTTPGEAERTLFYWDTIEKLEFKDRTLDLVARPLVFKVDAISGQSNPVLQDLTFQANGYEVAALVHGAQSVTVIDSGGENGGRDRLQYVDVNSVRGDVVIDSDALGRLSISNAGTGDITINAHAGERTLQINHSGVQLADGQRITDNTATDVILYSTGYSATFWNGAGDKDYNLSFASAETITFRDNASQFLIKWNIPNVTTIDMRVPDNWGIKLAFDENWSGNYGFVIIETALDDSILATAGGTAGYRFYGGDGREFVAIGNIGEGATTQYNAGQGLKGLIDLGDGADEARLLGAGAIDGGKIYAGANPEGSSDVIRMSFTTAYAIADISDSIFDFEAIQFDVDAGSHTVNADKFDDILELRIMGTDGAAGNNTVELAEDSVVTFKALSTANNFGTVNLVGGSSEINVLFADKFTQTQDYVGYEAERPDYDITGTVHIAEAIVVNITTAARTDYVPALRANIPFYPDLKLPGVNSFEFALVLDNATTVKLTGNAGWDFTIAGTAIGHVTTIDASGITGKGAFGAVKAYAVSDAAVSFTGGAGDDWFKGRAGSDTFVGGSGFDTVVFSGNLDDYTLSMIDGNLVVSGLGDGSDTLTGIERIVFNDVAIGASLDHQGAPYDINLSDVIALPEYAEAGTVVGTLSAADPNTDETFTYSLVNDFSGAFRLEGDKLVVADGSKLEFEFRNYANVTVRVTDSTGLSFDRQFAVEVTDVNPEHFVGTDGVDEWMGGDGNDYFEGGAGDDWTNAASGDDVLIGGAGNDTLQGIYGTDTAVYSGNREDYTVTQDPQYADLFRITDNRDGSPDGTDTLFMIDRVQFNDGVFAIGDLLAEPNQAPTVVLENLLPSLKENASTSQPIKIADIVVTDDGIGTNRLSVIGRDAALFQIIGMALFLKAGVLLDAATAAELEFAVAVDDDDLAGSPDAVSNTYALNIEDVAGYGVIRGTAAGERINGTSGDDVIIGNGGDDDMRGGKGNDTYIVDSIGDKVTEASGGGLDTVMSSVSYKLGNHVENLTLTGGGDIDGTGNSKNNVITGNDGNNILRGGDGNDTIYGGGGTDTIYGDAGNDKLYGGSGADKLYGGSGDDILDGGANADQMWGSSGNDVYYVDDEGDVVTESSSQGTDTIYASVNYTLGSSQERLYLTGTDEVSATGNTKDNRIGGNAAANELTGGAGKDAFVFNTALGNGNVDTIGDFNVKDDTIWLDNAFFVGVGKDGNLSSGAFFAGTAAHDASDRIIYDKDTGALYFDADGSGAGEQIQFAELDANLALTYKDFYVI